VSPSDESVSVTSSTHVTVATRRECVIPAIVAFSPNGGPQIEASRLHRGLVRLDRNMTRGRKFLRDARGFTLAELMMAAVAIGVIVAAAAPVWSTTNGIYKLRGEARRFYSELQKARMKSTMENRRYVVESKTSTFVVCQDADGNGACASTESPVTFDLAPNGISFSTSATAVSFFANGSATPATAFTLQNGRGATATISVGPAGRVRIS
jgi:prepilin-type N-terminal cleavage/methylation domain-containing protein